MTDRWDGMSEEEIAEESRRSWAAGVAASRARGDVLPEVSRVKRGDYPHLRFVGWSFELRRGAAAGWRATPADAWTPGTIQGRGTATDGDLVVLLETDGDVRALRRVDGLPWPDEPSVGVDDLDLEVWAWQLDGTDLADRASVVVLRGAPARGWARTADLDLDPDSRAPRGRST